MNAAAFTELLSNLLAPLVALALGAARIFGILAILPVFTRTGLTGLLRGGIALVLALPLLPALTPLVEAAPPIGGAALIALLVKEAVVGVVVGTVLSVPFWAAEAAGELMDQQRGSEAATIPDPSQVAEAGITGTLLVLTLTVIFFASGGMCLLLDAVYESWNIWPPLDPLPSFSADAGLRVLGLLDRVLRLGLVLAAPVLIALLLAEFALALIGRFAPSLNVFDLAMAVKGVVFALALPLYAVFLARYLAGTLAPLADAARELEGLAR
jgi:type III secretion protein T